ncbi:MAG: polymerase sigma-70 factor, subfamily [Frankiaceae bacterium]|nr:polymerase sigma-70 factor, subfamily [Frankiaceae bacterium]
MRVTRDLDLAEECAQDAFARALTAWQDAGVPDRPGAWLTTVARRRALDVLRREAALRRALPMLVVDDVEPEPELPTDAIPDDRLRLVFTCAHPALNSDAQVALTLRLLCGVTTAEIAKAFLVAEPTMAARLTRAKKKIAVARIPYRVPGPEQLPERLDAVLTVVHLLFTVGHTAPSGPDLVRSDLVDRALDLARMLRQLLPGDAEVAGLLALLELTHARRATRTDASGRMLLLEEQDRSRWDRDAIAAAIPLVRESLRARPAGRFALQAAIAAVHAEAPSYADTDWREIVALYGVLWQRWPSPVVALNRAVAVGLADGPGAGLAELEPLGSEPALATYAYLPAARADFLRRLGRYDEAAAAYAEAALLTDNDVEREFLRGRYEQVRTASGH